MPRLKISIGGSPVALHGFKEERWEEVYGAGSLTKKDETIHSTITVRLVQVTRLVAVYSERRFLLPALL